MKTNRHSLMAKGILVLLSLLIIVFIITFAWYAISQPDANTQGLSAKTKSGTDFEYAIGFSTSQTGGQYLVTDFTNSENLSLDIEHLNVPGHYVEGSNSVLFDYNLLYDYTPIDITGDGVNLIRPNMDYGNWKINTGTNDYGVAEANTQYISFDIIVRSRAECTLSLGPNSYAVGACEYETNSNGEKIEIPNGAKLKQFTFSSGSNAPVSPAFGDYWFSTADNKLKTYDGSAWQESDQVCSVGNTVPANPVVGQWWYDTSGEVDVLKVCTNAESNPTVWQTYSLARPSDYASGADAFSRDAIVGATRVAFIEFNDSNITADNLISNTLGGVSLDNKLADESALLWVTRPDLYLSNNPQKDSDPSGATAGTNHETDVFGWGLITRVASNRTFDHHSTAVPQDSAYTTYRHQQYDIFNMVDGLRHNAVVTNNNSYVHVSKKDEDDDSYKFNDTVALTGITYPKTINGTQYYYGKIRVRIWVEGTDSESRRALSGGKFNVNFDLTTK